MGGSSAPAGASGVPSNSIPTAEIYQPTGQPQADVNLQSIFGGFMPTSTQYTGGNPLLGGLQFPNTPGGNEYPYGILNYQGPGTVTDPGNPYVQSALGTASGLTSPYSSLVSQLSGQTGAGSQSTGSAQNYANLMTSLLGNQVFPTIANMYGAANQISGLGNQVAPGVASLVNNQQAPNIGNQIMYGIGGALPTAISNANTAAGNLYGYGNQVLNTGFDPQSALFNQLENQVSQQTAAANAAAGLGGSGYGASNTSNTLSNFDINWQNQQLGRQTQALGAAEPAFTTASGLLPGALQAAGNAANIGENLTAAPYQLGGAIAQGVSNILGQGANLYNQGTNQFASDLGQWYGAQQAPLQTAAAQAGALGTADQTLNQLAGQPYNIQATQSQNALQTLANLTNIGNQQYVPTQQLANDLQSYLGLGQSASQISGQLGALGQNELLNSAAGIGSALGTGSNLLFGNSLGSSGGLLGAAGLNPFTSSAAGALGSGAADFGGSIGTVGAAAGPTFADAAGGAFGGGDLAAVGAADAGTAGGGGALASLLPFGAS
jgi:hypothetical protein